MSTWFPAPAIPLLLIALAAAIATFAVVARSKKEARGPIPAPPPKPGGVWVIVNPTKTGDYDGFRNQVDAICEAVVGEPPHWLETTPEDPGTGPALQALKAKPRVVLAAGGDGTVRAVAAGVAHSGVPLGILPMGTGNLTARNLRIPLDLPTALVVGLTGAASQIDLAWLRMENVEVPPEMPAEGALLQKGDARRVRYLPPGKNEPSEDEFAYLVIAGMGFDGETMAKTSPRLKRIFGWPAYVYSALQALRVERMRATLTLYSPGGGTTNLPSWMRAVPTKLLDSIEASQTLGEDNPVLNVLRSEDDLFSTHLRARTILFANCGELPFAVLAPDAKVDDGALDVIAIDTKAGLAGWVSLSVKVFGQGLGFRAFNTRHDLGQISFQQVREVRADTHKAHRVQVDGDAVGSARTVIARVDSGALIIHVADEMTARRVASAQAAASARRSR